MVRFLMTVGITGALLAFIAVASYSDAVAPRHLSAYFPAGQIRANEAADAEYGEKLTNALSAMKLPNGRDSAQPSMFIPPPSSGRNDKEYRAIIGRDGEYIMAIRAFQGGGGSAQIVANRVDAHDSGRSATLDGKLTGTNWTTLFRAVEASGLMRPPHAAANYAGDCPDWVFEAREGARYELMSVTCTNDPAVKAMQDAFLKAAGWTVY